jgi:hypothetical protein
MTALAKAVASISGLHISVTLFDTAFPAGPAYGTTERTTWDEFASSFRHRREGIKDGRNFIPATFAPEPDGRVRRVKANILARTAIALDCETNKETGEVPPPFAEAVARVKAQGWVGVIYTSHSHTSATPRYRVVVPLSEEIPAELPGPEVVAAALGLHGVLDISKIGASSLFYFPSAAAGHLANHETALIDGKPVSAAWMRARGATLQAEREAERQRQRAEAMEAAAKRREEKINAGFDPATSIIEAVRNRLDIEAELIGNGYERKGNGRYLYPGSETGVAGVYLLPGRDGVQRVYSHHAADPLAAGNLPSWCRAKAIDVVDVAAILDHGGDLRAALRAMALRFGITAQRFFRPASQPIGFGISHDNPMQRQRYANAALQSAIVRVVRADAGRRTNTLAHELFSLMRLARSGDLQLREIAAAMAIAARHAGLDAVEARTTITGALRAGAAG